MAASDTNGLYNAFMGSGAQGGITQTGSSGSYVYTAKTGFENKPVNFISFWDALCFTNWLHNGQPSGTQDASTTEDGAYTITTQGVTDNSIVRNLGALFFLPEQDEWYKAAYYDPATLTYSLYPAQSDSAPLCVDPGFAFSSKAANCHMGVAALTLVGSYTFSPSFYGTFDQGGNVAEWNETIFFSNRFRLGGEWTIITAAVDLASTEAIASPPVSETRSLGFRVAAVPEPGTVTLLLAAGLSLLLLRRVRGASAV